MERLDSFSLDVNATGTTSPRTLEITETPRRNLRSISLENNLSNIEVTGRNLVKPILKSMPCHGQDILQDPIDKSIAYKTPSYLGISCTVNGYSRLNRYDSSLRDSFRSQDETPSRLTVSRSRDSSPLRPEWKLLDGRRKLSPEDTAAKIKELKEELARFKLEFPHNPSERGRPCISRNLGRRPSQLRSVSVDRGYLGKANIEIMDSEIKDTKLRGDVHFVEVNMDERKSTTTYNYSLQKSVITNEHCQRSDSLSCSETSTNSQHTKSFIQSRIERLYGKNALAAGFRSRRSLLELEKEQKERQSGVFKNTVITASSENGFELDEKAPEGFPIVFRHLRPEFRTQLPVKRSNFLKLGTSSELSSGNSSNDGKVKHERVIPIRLEGEEIIPPVPLPKTELFKQKEADTITLQNNSHLDKSKAIGNDTHFSNGVNGKENAQKETNVEDETKKTKNVNGIAETSQLNEKNSSTFDVEKDGKYYLQNAKKIIANIEEEVQAIEADMEVHESQMTEEVRGKVLAGIGKARLLISQKIQQFIGLCHKNINGSGEEDFPTTVQDLAGFWDMVSIQVDDIHRSLQEITKLKASGWKEISWEDTSDKSRTVMTGHAHKKPAPRPVRVAKSSKSVKTEKDKARDEARKKLMEERRQAMKEAMKAKKAEAETKGSQHTDDNAVEIFISEN